MRDLSVPVIFCMCGSRYYLLGWIGEPFSGVFLVRGTQWLFVLLRIAECLADILYDTLVGRRVSASSGFLSNIRSIFPICVDISAGKIGTGRGVFLELFFEHTRAGPRPALRVFEFFLHLGIHDINGTFGSTRIHDTFNYPFLVFEYFPGHRFTFQGRKPHC